jgi:outer membrane lipoprotein SlyB
MTTDTRGTAHPIMWIAGIAVTLFCAVGIAAIMGWIPTSGGTVAEKAALTQPEKTQPAPVPHASVAKPKPAPSRTPPPPPVAAAPVSVAPPVQVASNVPARAICADCGVVESARVVETRGEGSGIGVVGGAVVGGLLGNQVGSGNGNKIATVAGAVGGAVAGNEVEKRVKTKKSYEVVVRFEDGRSRVFHEANSGGWRVGDRVRVVDGVIRSNS